VHSDDGLRAAMTATGRHAAVTDRGLLLVVVVVCHRAHPHLSPRQTGRRAL
jgi:hypothetical protein